MMGLPVTGCSRTSLDTTNPPRSPQRRRRSATYWVRHMLVQLRAPNHYSSRAGIGELYHFVKRPDQHTKCNELRHRAREYSRQVVSCEVDQVCGRGKDCIGCIDPPVRTRLAAR